MSKAAVIIPIYKETLHLFEEISLQQVRNVLCNYTIIFIAPKNINFSYLSKDDIIIRFDPEYFINIFAYNKLMLSTDFYETFLGFDYILLYQLDAFVFYDALDYFCQLNYDYIGAPWPFMWIYPFRKHYIHVGNGGFSLRKVKSCYRVLKEYNALVTNYLNNKINEDTFFSHCSICGKFNIAPINIAYKFSMEFRPSRSIVKNNNELPFGCHGWHVYEPKFYTQLLKYYGYDLTNILDRFEDKCMIINEWLAEIIKHRIAMRIKNRQSIIHYLSSNDFNTVYVIGNNKDLLEQLLIDKPDITNIYVYNNIDEIKKISEDKFLLLYNDNDVSLIQQLQDNNYFYGEHYISFFYECKQYYQNKLNILSMKDK